jgi:hypothetical protein
MKSWKLVATVVVAIGLGLLVVLQLQGQDHATSADDAGNRPDATNNRAPSTTTSPPTSAAPTERHPSASPAPSTSRIETTSSTYFGRPFETIQIQGRYRGVPRPTRLRVQIQQPSGWTQYPLPAVTQPSGQFRAFVELGGPKRYRLRIVDPTSHHASAVVTLLVF